MADKCPNCRNAPRTGICPECKGTGKKDLGMFHGTTKCSHCGGSGVCPVCKGKGKIY